MATVRDKKRYRLTETRKQGKKRGQGDADI